MSIFTSVGKQFVWTDENIITQERSLVPSIWLELSKERRFSFLSRSIFTSVEKHFVWTDENIRSQEGRFVPLNSWENWLNAGSASGRQRQGWQRVGCLLWTWVVLWVIHLNPVGLSVVKLQNWQVQSQRRELAAGLLSVKFLSMANDVFFRRPFAKR